MEVIEPKFNKNGYLYNSLKINDRSCNLLRHRLVAIAFIPNPDNYPIVNHLDGNKANPHVSNLEWTTQRGNVIHAIMHDLRGKITCAKVVQICMDLESGKYSMNEIAKRHGVERYDVSCIKNNQNWKFISGMFNIQNCKLDWKAAPEETVRQICMLIEENTLMLDEIAELVGVSHYVVCQIYHRRSFKDIVKDYNFSNYDKYQRYDKEFLNQIREYMRQGYTNIQIRDMMNLEKGGKTNTLLHRQRLVIDKENEFKSKSISEETVGA